MDDGTTHFTKRWTRKLSQNGKPEGWSWTVNRNMISGCYLKEMVVILIINITQNNN